MQHSTLAYPTLYASALITFNKGGYTKHYFEGTNRVCSKIGGGFYHVHMDSIENRVPALAGGYEDLSDDQRESVEHTFNDCLGLEVETDGIVDLYDVIKHESKRHDPEPAFFYHSDHLGSAAYLTNDAGQVTQTLNYLPYGEDWVDIQNSLDPNLGMYTYNGKEKDYESGFHYYGARYYWSELLTGWLSVDPMADKYPSLSPYNYCAWNPVKFVDPNGMDTAFAGSAERELYHKYREIQKELIQLEKAKEVFCIRMGDNISNSEGGGNFTYNSNTGQFDINIDCERKWTDIEKLSHELKHADQYLNRKLTILLKPSGQMDHFFNYSIDDELEAYNRQGMFGNTWNSDDIFDVYGKQMKLSFHGHNRPYKPSDDDIRTNATFYENFGHPRILYQGWEDDLYKVKK